MNAHMAFPTLYDIYQDRCDTLAAQGYGAIADMATYFGNAVDMATALGLSHAAVDHWMQGRNTPARTSNQRAKLWLANATLAKPAAQLSLPITPDPTTMLMVVCDRAKVEKVQKILAMIGCEVVEI